MMIVPCWKLKNYWAEVPEPESDGEQENNHVVGVFELSPPQTIFL